MIYLILNFSELIPESILLSKFIKRDRNDPAFEKDLKILTCN